MIRTRVQQRAPLGAALPDTPDAARCACRRRRQRQQQRRQPARSLAALTHRAARFLQGEQRRNRDALPPRLLLQARGETVEQVDIDPEADVLLVRIAGSGVVKVAVTVHALAAGQALLIPQGGRMRYFLHA